MNSEQQAFLLAHLESSKAALDDAVRDCNETEWSRKPAAASWTIGECAEHIVIVESLIFKGLQQLPGMVAEPYSEEDCRRKDAQILLVSESTTKIEAPLQTKPTSRYSGVEEMLNAFHPAHYRFSMLVEENPDWLRGRFRPHPLLQKLDGYQWILAASCHTLRHVGQIREIQQLLAAQPIC